MSSTAQRLQAGGDVRIYRDGTEIFSIVRSGSDGALVVRSLPVGVYVARDEVGGEVPFVVAAHEDETVVQAGKGVSVQPGAALVQEEPRPEEDEAIFPPQPSPRSFPKHLVPGDEGVGVLAEPGSALVGEELPDRDEEAAADFDDPTVIPRDSRAQSGNVGHVPLAERVKVEGGLPGADTQPEDSASPLAKQAPDSADSDRPLTQWTVDELRAELDRLGKPAPSKTNKDALVRRLRRARAS